MGTLKDDLRGPGVEMLETHISWVFLGERDVYKVKKPVDLGFLDFSTLAKRRAACEAELRLNRRLTEGVYLAIVPVTRGDDGRHRLGGPGEPVDWAVRMRRLPDHDRTDARLARGELTPHHVAAVAERVVRFHDAARADEETARWGAAEAFAVNVQENFEQTRDTLPHYLSVEEAEEVRTWQLRFLEEKAALFAERVRQGRVRDGHGDLRLDQIYIDDHGRVTILDCIEFNDRFRYADVCADVAFLGMDLAWHGRVDLAEGFLARYAREANDYDLYPLVDFYESYRAFVRGKVASFLVADEGAEPEARRRAAAEARRYYLLALASERRTLLPPAVVAVGGLIASGKTTVAERVAAEIMAPVVDADRTRKHLLGVEPTEPVHEAAFEGAYSRETSEAVYRELLRRAGAVLASGRPVVLDTSFRTRRLRQAARRLAEEGGVPFHFLECRAGREVCRERLRQREQETGVSDGRLEIFDDFAARWEPVEELPESEHLVLDTSRPLAPDVEILRHRLTTWPVGFHH